MTELTIPALNAPCSLRPRRPTTRAATPEALADVALIDGPSLAAAACISVSQFYELVRTGQAPQPVIRAPRCTRWRMTDGRDWLKRLAHCGSSGQTTLTPAGLSTALTEPAQAKCGPSLASAAPSRAGGRAATKQEA